MKWGFDLPDYWSRIGMLVMLGEFIPKMKSKKDQELLESTRTELLEDCREIYPLEAYDILENCAMGNKDDKERE